MLAAWYDRQGPADAVLVVGEVADPVAGPGQVRVRVHASGVNPSDVKGRSGFSGGMPYPRITPHQDGAGVIDQVGDGVPSARVGERVWVYEAQRGQAGGTAAGYAVVPAHKAVPLPADVSFEVGACLGVPAMTAHRCLFADGRPRHVLVHGGAGAVGTAAILLAKWAGARVIATVSREAQAAVARAAGAEVVLNRRTDDVAAGVRAAVPGGVDRIVDVALCENIGVDLDCLALNGVITAYAAAKAEDTLALPFLRAMRQGVVIRLVFVYEMSAVAHADAVADITAALQSGAYAPVIGARFGLDAIAAGHAAQESGTVVGKVLVTP
jgi:NADPH:quinone reductase-like Zn-dependent oxidoreductase